MLNVPVYVIAWRAEGEAMPGVPTKQTLERVVCTALASIDPARAASVDRWLKDAPAPGSAGHKAHAGSYMAKWYEKLRADRFYQLLMMNEQTREALKKLLADVWYVFERLAA